MTLTAAGPTSTDAVSAQTRFAYHDGQFVPAAEVRLPISTQALHYGTGVFEGIRGYFDAETGTLQVFRLADHLQRLERSAAVLRLDLGHSVDEIGELVLKLLVANKCRHNTYIRPIAYKFALEPGTPFGVRLTGLSSRLTLTTLPMGTYVEQRGLRCKLSRYRRVPAVSVPSDAKISGVYVNNALAMEDAAADGCDDAILLGIDGHVTEATTSNVFMVLAGDQVVTPPADADLLPGITRATVLELLAAELGIEAIQRPVSPEELRSAREVFLTGTGVEIAAVRSLDGREYSQPHPDSVTSRVQRLYAEVVRGRHPAYQHWLTPVGFPPSDRIDNPAAPRTG
jgi:branched-chain amino acid aminotransferase